MHTDSACALWRPLNLPPDPAGREDWQAARTGGGPTENDLGNRWRPPPARKYLTACTPVFQPGDPMSLSRLADDILPQRPAAPTDASRTPTTARSGASQAFDALSKFIPAEMLAPYVAFLAYSAEHGAPPAESVYWWFVVATPLVTAFFLFAKHAADDRPWPPMAAVIWRSLAAAVAFAVWGLAPPGSAFQAGVGGPAIAGLAAVIVSPLLTGMDVIVLRLMGVRGDN